MPPPLQGWSGCQGGSMDPAGGATGLPPGPTRVPAPGTVKLERRSLGWGWVGKSAEAATELTVAGDVVVPGRVAGGPRGASELQEKCQVVEGAQRHSERGPHGERSGRGAAASHRGSGDRRPRARRSLPDAAWLPSSGRCPSPTEPGPAPAPALARPQPSPGSGPAPAAVSERTPSRPPPTAGLFPSAEGHSARRRCRRTPSLPLPPARPEEAAAEGSAA